jgi:anaerobic magnesium-protoporphyrin IX monomethyl ester cyclase
MHLMRRAGCVKVYLGLESGDNETLGLMKKRATVEDGIRATYNFNDAGIKVGAFFIVGYPGETIESVERTFSLAQSLPLDEISFNVPYPLPGSPLFSRLRGLNSDDDWDIENETKFLFESEFDSEWLKNKIEETMSKFKNKPIAH